MSWASEREATAAGRADAETILRPAGTLPRSLEDYLRINTLYQSCTSAELAQGCPLAAAYVTAFDARMAEARALQGEG